MNLGKLFKMQKELDDRIEKEHPSNGENRLPKKILALQVELGELANELPEVFKFWSNKKNNYEKALKEYVDCLHFVLSIGNDLNEKPRFNFQLNKNETVVDSFLDVMENANGLDINSTAVFDYDILFMRFYELGVIQLGFTWGQIEQAYFEKNAVNHARQSEGY